MEHRPTWAIKSAYAFGLRLRLSRPTGLEHWLRSLAVHYARRPLGPQCLEARFGTADPATVAEGWRALREEHHRRVCAELPPGRLLVFDIESDPPERLCAFIDAPPALARHYRVENPSLNRWGEALAACLPLAVKRALPARLKRPVKRWLGARRAPVGGSG